MCWIMNGEMYWIMNCWVGCFFFLLERWKDKKKSYANFFFIRVAHNACYSQVANNISKLLNYTIFINKFWSHFFPFPLYNVILKIKNIKIKFPLKLTN